MTGWLSVISFPNSLICAEVRLTRERTEFRFAKDATTYPLVLRNYTTSYEDEYQRRLLSGLHPEWLIALPLLAELPGVAWVAVTEAHIEDYAGMYLGHGSSSLLSRPGWRRARTNPKRGGRPAERRSDRPGAS